MICEQCNTDYKTEKTGTFQLVIAKPDSETGFLEELLVEFDTVDCLKIWIDSLIAKRTANSQKLVIEPVSTSKYQEKLAFNQEARRMRSLQR
ncbi:MAG: hypothetical protein ACTSP4_00080 [Candidatus Hodarchaeales archaeon]